MRLTVIDAAGAISFVTPPHGAKMLTAACSKGAQDAAELFAIARPFDSEMVDTILDGLALFDEHNTPENYAAIHDILATTAPLATPPFRVVDPVTRQASLSPVSTGLILFNLPARRIVQVQNSYAALLRRDRGRIRTSGRPTRHLYRYVLPDEWQMVP